MTLHEPTTVATDLLLAALAGWLAMRLRRSGPAHRAVQRWWIRVFWLTSAAALVGGVSHGIGPDLPAAAAQSLWRSTLLLLNLMSAAMGVALLQVLVPPARQRPWRWLIGGKLAVFGVTAFVLQTFGIAIADYGLALLAWLIAAVVRFRPWMLAAVAISVVAAAVQQFQWDVSVHVTHNDIYHVIQAVALVCFFRAALAEGDCGDLPARR